MGWRESVRDISIRFDYFIQDVGYKKRPDHLGYGGEPNVFDWLRRLESDLAAIKKHLGICIEDVPAHRAIRECKEEKG